MTNNTTIDVTTEAHNLVNNMIQANIDMLKELDIFIDEDAEKYTYEEIVWDVLGDNNACDNSTLVSILEDEYEYFELGSVCTLEDYLDSCDNAYEELLLYAIDNADGLRLLLHDMKSNDIDDVYVDINYYTGHIDSICAGDTAKDVMLEVLKDMADCSMDSDDFYKRLYYDYIIKWIISGDNIRCDAANARRAYCGELFACEEYVDDMPRWARKYGMNKQLALTMLEAESAVKSNRLHGDVIAAEECRRIARAYLMATSKNED